MLERDEYISLVARQLEYIPSHVVVERLTGDAPLEELVAPLWSIKKTTILNDIDKYMKAHDIMQGDLVSSNNIYERKERISYDIKKSGQKPDFFYYSSVSRRPYPPSLRL